ncbi:hypothetical protein OAH18_03680, partial [bacterium]|nr:hypothetical protein [bacterium]
ALQERIAFVRKHKADEAQKTRQSSAQELMQVLSDLKTNVIQQMEKDQMKYREFRKNAPLMNFGKGENPVAVRARKFREEKTALDLEKVSLEVLEGQLSGMVELSKNFEGEKLKELQKRQRPNVVAIMGDALIGSVGDPQENLAAVQAKLNLLNDKLEVLNMGLARIEQEARVLHEYELRDEAFRKEIAQKQQLYDALRDKLESIDLTLEYAR